MTTTLELPGIGTVNRLGFGAMRITGDGIWGPPRDHDEAIAVLRRAVELGVDFIDTADSYGPYISEELIAEALHPYGEVKVATKAGLVRTGPGVWVPVGRPDYLRQESEVSVEEVEAARAIVPVATVQNLYNLANRKAEDVLDHCEAKAIGFIPWYPLAGGPLSEPGGPLATAAEDHGTTPGAIALAWLL